jgi:hypothetical protein
MTSNASGSERLSSIVAQYETLRQAALGHALPPEARGGLMLFLHRGMWGWTQAVAIAGASVSEQPSYSPSLKWPPSGESRTLIQVFAALAMKADNRGATP